MMRTHKQEMMTSPLYLEEVESDDDKEQQRSRTRTKATTTKLRKEGRKQLQPNYENAFSQWFGRLRLDVVAVAFGLVIAAYAISNILLDISLERFERDNSSITASHPEQLKPQSTTTAMGHNTNYNNYSDGNILQCDADYKLLDLKIVTMNMAGMEISQSAPSSWTASQQQQAFVGEILASNPDVIFLQECPTASFPPPGMFDYRNGTIYHKMASSVHSHAGYVTLLVRSDLVATPLDVVVIPESLGLPIVATVITWKGRQIVLASVHLEPFERGSVVRRDQIQSLLMQASDIRIAADILVFAGDTNMRDVEDASMESLGLVDVWKQGGALEETRYSWDTLPHGNRQNLYYGAETRAYQRRYDRIYVKDLKMPLSFFRVDVPVFHFIGNQPVSDESSYHYLSDHFGITTEIQLCWQE